MHPDDPMRTTLYSHLYSMEAALAAAMLEARAYRELVDSRDAKPASIASQKERLRVAMERINGYSAMVKRAEEI